LQKEKIRGNKVYDGLLHVILLQRAVDDIEPTRFQTYTSHALNKTVSDFMSSDGFNDSNTAKVLILLTDGM